MIRSSVSFSSMVAGSITPDVVYELQQTRRILHQHPELSFQEFKTADYIRKRLETLEIPFRPIAETGTIAYIGSGPKCVGLRADIDALPITEATGLDFASETDGVMHACGHDMHTAMLLGAARVLKGLEQTLPGTVVLVFQPGEEKTPGGASLILAGGGLDNPRPEMMFAQHADPDSPAGVLSFADGAMMASADELTWTVRGRGAHAAQPHKSADPLYAAAGLVHHLQGVFARFRNPLHQTVLTVTSIHGGTAFNVIPETVTMLGTLRSFSQEWRHEAWALLEQHTREYCRLYGCDGEIDINRGYPALVNHPTATQLARSTALHLVGEHHVREFEPKMWAEDFAYYALQIPSCFWMLGVRPHHQDEMPGLHHPQFNPDEGALELGVRMLVSTAITYLHT